MENLKTICDKIICSKCGERCYYEAYPQAIENNNGKIVCEICFEEEN